MAEAALIISVFSALAAIASVVVAWRAHSFSQKTHEESEQQAKNLNRRDLFLSLYEKLCDTEQIRGRRVIREKCRSEPKARRLGNSNEELARAAVGALAMLDTLGLYVEQKYVEQDLVMAEWGHVLVELQEPANLFLQFRDVNGQKPWPHFGRLTQAAADWAQNESCSRDQPGRAR
ncbi:hypothetical protein ACM01_44215 [Streptomyces viridochromogenes]|uniref:Uncharacterized protein n=1 Tax=Streptomyces viridochromogenes TaxID=1938 RepID=A0A0J7YU68_STRVR|nr:hypothetical protein [Streptomyces viridochromogenes]KMS67019.1 hypothetical protein ACM01_44215 [Streptomyces viridochromogenes]